MSKVKNQRLSTEKMMMTLLTNRESIRRTSLREDMMLLFSLLLNVNSLLVLSKINWEKFVRHLKTLRFYKLNQNLITRKPSLINTGMVSKKI
jgi:hypothetical protein